MSCSTKSWNRCDLSLKIQQLGGANNSSLCKIDTDIVDSAAPCLIARQSLWILGAQIDVATNFTTVRQGVQIQPIASGSGHIQLPENPAPRSMGKFLIDLKTYPSAGDFGGGGGVDLRGGA